MLGLMETDLSTTVGAVILEESVFTIGGHGNESGGGGGGGGGGGILLAPRHDPLYIVIPMTVIYSLIFVTGVVGNVVTIVVIVRNKYMHTATNYYLFSLAISDLLLLISGLPQEMVSIWFRYPYLFGEVFCVLRGLSAETSTNASVLTITAFTVERYVAICHPFLSQTMSNLSRAVKLIFLIWFLAFSFAVPQAIQFGVVAIDGDPNQAVCTLKWTVIDHSFVFSSFFFFVTPMTLITVLYVLIGIKLKKSNMMKRTGSSVYSNCENRGSQRGRDHPPQPHQHHQSSKRVLKMLVAVVVAFFICWAPFHAQRLVYTYGSNDENKPKGAVLKLIYEIITYISGILYYVSSTINPILYHIMSHKFREAFKDTLARCTCSGRVKSRRGRRSYFILNRYYRRGPPSRRETQSFDIDNCSNFVREDSIPSNSITYDMPLSKYKFRRKTFSLSETTDDSTRTELTQISHKADSPSRGSSQNQFAAVVVKMGILEFQSRERPERKERFWKSGKNSKKNKLWKVINYIRTGSGKKIQVESDSAVRSRRIPVEKPIHQEERILPAGNSEISGNCANGKNDRDVSNNAIGGSSRNAVIIGSSSSSSSSGKLKTAEDKKSVVSPIVLDLEENGNGEKGREKVISASFEPLISGENNFPSPFAPVKLTA